MLISEKAEVFKGKDLSECVVSSNDVKQALKETLVNVMYTNVVLNNGNNTESELSMSISRELAEDIYNRDARGNEVCIRNNVVEKVESEFNFNEEDLYGDIDSIAEIMGSGEIAEMLDLMTEIDTGRTNNSEDSYVDNVYTQADNESLNKYEPKGVWVYRDSDYLIFERFQTVDEAVKYAAKKNDTTILCDAHIINFGVLDKDTAYYMDTRNNTMGIVDLR